MSYWSNDRLETMKKIQKKKIRNRSIAIGLLIPEILVAFIATVFAILATEVFWTVVFAFFFIFSVYILIKQIQFLHEDLKWRPREPNL